MARTKTRAKIRPKAVKPPALRKARRVSREKDPSAGLARATRVIERTPAELGIAQRARAAAEIQGSVGLGLLREERAQPTLEIGPVGDPREHEAEAAARNVVAGRDAFPPSGRETVEQEEKEKPVQNLTPSRTVGEEPEALRRAASGEDAAEALRRAIPGEEPAETIRRQSEEEGEAWPEPSEDELAAAGEGGGEGEVMALRRKEAGPEGGPVSDPGLASRIRSPEGGRPLPGSVRETMEPRFDADFTGVRVHDGPRDRADTAAVGARAFARGSDVWLGPGESETDTHLMAHELTHVVQQGGAPRRSPAKEVKPARRRVMRLFGIPDWVWNKLAGWAQEIPGYKLVAFALGKDPISGKAMERNAGNLLGAVLQFVPGGEKLYKQVVESGALARAFAWLQEQLVLLNITWAVIKSLFRRALDTISAGDVFRLGAAWDRLKGIFMPPILRVIRFAKNVGGKILEFVFEGAMALAGPLAKRVLAILKKAGATFMTIIRDPVGFLKNLLGALMKGFRQFAGNILTHLKTGLMGWLFGTLADAGLQMPEKLDLKGILSIVLQILGLTYARIRARLVKVLGEKRVAMIEKVVEVVRVLVTEEIAGLWKMLMEHLGNLKDIVIEAIKSFVITKIVTAAVTKIVSMFNPVGAIVQAVITVYNVIKWLIERIEQILALVEAVVNSIAKIAAGQIGEAANWVEKTLARTLPVIISFLAGLLGLGGIAAKIKAIIQKIQEKVGKAIDKVVAFVVKKAKALFGKGKASVKKGLAKAKALLWPKTTFEANGEKHEITVSTASGQPQTMVASGTPKTVESLLDDIEDMTKGNEDLNEEKCLKEIGKAREAAAALAEAELAWATTDTPAKKKKVVDGAIALSAALKKVFSACKVQLEGGEKEDEGAVLLTAEGVYALEGLTGKYNQMAEVGGDETTPDHQPSSKVIKVIAGIRDKKGLLFEGADIQKAAGSASAHSPGGLTINLAHVRHVKTRTYGSGGEAVGKDVEEKATAKIKEIESAHSSPKSKEARNQKRNSLIAIARKNLNDDADVVETGIVTRGRDDKVWSDIRERLLTKTDGTKKTKLSKADEKVMDKVIATQRKRIKDGEKTMRAQDLSAWKTGAKG